MDLRQRLAGVGYRVGGARPRLRADPLAALLGGAEHATRLGACFVVERAFPLDHRHGRWPLGAALAAREEAIALLGKAGALSGFQPRRALFLDTETTGLAGGTGISCFLVGAGWFEPDCFRLRQVFMRTPAEEAALLEMVLELARAFESLVSFNGKAFDLPLLETRLVLARRREGLRFTQHLDLCHPARRMWRDHLATCRLSELEALVLGHRRGEDLPSALIPALYFRFVREGATDFLPAIFQHNAQDVLALVGLTAHFAHLLDDPERVGTSGSEWLGLARVYEAGGRLEASAECLRRALQEELAPEQRRRALGRLALLARRLGCWDEAVRCWRELAAAPGGDPLALVELARYHERRERDLRAAIAAAEAALAALSLRQRRDPAMRWVTLRQEVERRLARLLAQRA